MQKVKIMSINSKLQTPLVSVIIPTFNRPSYLKKAIESAIRQTYRNIEIIVSDNCSPENPQALVESFQDPRIRFSRNPTNLGMFANTRNAFKKARGKYAASLLDDDMWEEDFLEKLVPPLEAAPDLVLAFCDHYVINAENEIDSALTEHCSQLFNRADLKEGIYQPFCELSLVQGAVSSATAAVLRLDVVNWDSIPPEVGGSWDMYLNYLYCRSGLGAYYYPAKLTRVRVHEQSETMLSGKRDVEAKIRKAKAEVFCYEHFMKDDRLQKLRPYFQQKWVHVNTTLGIGLMRAKQREEARSYFWRALRQRFNLRTTAALMLSFTPPQMAARF
jgi:glycosyltransferase involved in cell wall biosynthesis